MEVKSIRDCLNIIDNAIIENNGGISSSGTFHKYLLEEGQNEFIEDWVVLSNVLSQINSIKENNYRFPDEDKKMNMYS